MRYSKISTRWFGLIALMIIMALSSTLMAQQIGSAASFSKKVSYDADDASLSNIFTALARLSGANIVLAVDSSADKQQTDRKISVHIKDVQIEQAVSLVARSAGMSYRVIGENTFLVGDKTKIMEESGERTYVIPLSNIDAVKISKALANAPGRTVPIEGQNALLLVGNPDTYDQILSLVQGMDVPQKQIEIRVRLIEIILTNAKKYGVDWSKLNHLTTILAEDPVNGAGGAGLPYNFTDQSGYLPFGDPVDFELMPQQQYFQRINGFNDMGHFSRQLTAFDVTIDWLLENNAAKLLTDTRVTAMNGEQAIIHIGETVPYVAKNTENAYQVEQINTGIILDVTPMINKDGQITAKISPEVSSIVDFVAGYLPRTKVRKVTSTVTVPDGKKIIVGGLLNSTLTQKTVKLPLLGDIPILGKLFQHRAETTENTDLIMEITPRMVTNDEITKEPKVDERLSKHLIEYEGDEEDVNN